MRTGFPIAQPKVAAADIGAGVGRAAGRGMPAAPLGAAPQGMASMFPRLRDLFWEFRLDSSLCTHRLVKHFFSANHLYCCASFVVFTPVFKKAANFLESYRFY